MIYPSICVEIDQESKDNEIDANLWSYDSDWFNYSYNRLSYLKKKLEKLLEMQFGLSLNLPLLPGVQALPVSNIRTRVLLHRTLDHHYFRQIGANIRYYGKPSDLARIKSILEENRTETIKNIFHGVTKFKSEQALSAIAQKFTFKQVEKFIKTKIFDIKLTVTAVEYIKYAPDRSNAILRTAEVTTLLALDFGSIFGKNPTSFGSILTGMMLAERLKSWEETITRDKTRLLIIKNVIGDKFPIDADTILSRIHSLTFAP